MRYRFKCAAALVVLNLFAGAAAAQTVLDSPELYPGEKAVYEAAKKEGMVVSFDTGPTWANWAAEFAAFKKRYPEVEIVYNDIGNVQPGLDYLGKLHQSGNVLRVLGTTPYAQFVKGEIPIWISYENDGLKAKYTDGLGDAVAVVIPKEASAAAPYAISLVDKGPNPNAGKLWLNFIMTDMGQGIFAQG